MIGIYFDFSHFVYRKFSVHTDEKYRVQRRGAIYSIGFFLYDEQLPTLSEGLLKRCSVTFINEVCENRK